jgi:hypothetical protein
MKDKGDQHAMYAFSMTPTSDGRWQQQQHNNTNNMAQQQHQQQAQASICRYPTTLSNRGPVDNRMLHQQPPNAFFSPYPTSATTAAASSSATTATSAQAVGAQALATSFRGDSALAVVVRARPASRTKPAPITADTTIW